MKATFKSKEWGKFMGQKLSQPNTLVVASKGKLPDVNWVAKFLGWSDGTGEG